MRVWILVLFFRLISRLHCIMCSLDVQRKVVNTLFVFSRSAIFYFFYYTVRISQLSYYVLVLRLTDLFYPLRCSHRNVPITSKETLNDHLNVVLI